MTTVTTLSSSTAVLAVTATTVVLILGIETAEEDVTTTIEEGTETETEQRTNVIVIAGNGVETTIGIGTETETETEIATPEVAAAALTETEIGSDFASAGRLAGPKLMLRTATSIRRCTSSAGADSGGRRSKSRGTAIAGGRTAEVGIVSMSLGRAETMTGAREVRDTKEGIQDDVVVGTLSRWFTSSHRSETNRTTGYYAHALPISSRRSVVLLALEEYSSSC